MPHLEIHLRLSEPEKPEDIEAGEVGLRGAGWILGVKFWDDKRVEMLTAEPVSISQVVKIAKAVKMRGDNEGDLMPWVETLTVKLLDLIEEAIHRHELFIEAHRQALDPLAKIHRHAVGEKAVRHAQVEQASIVAAQRAKQQREILEAQMREEMEVPA